MSVASWVVMLGRGRMGEQMVRPASSFPDLMAVTIWAAVQPLRPVESGVRLLLWISFVVDPPSLPDPPSSAATVVLYFLPPMNALVASSCSGAVAAVFGVWQVAHASAARYLPLEMLPAPLSMATALGRSASATGSHCAAEGCTAKVPVLVDSCTTAGTVRK